MDRRRAASLPVIAIAAALTLVPTLSAYGDVLVNDDQIVIGNTCVGFDCQDGESFTATELKLKENNLRLRLFDTTASGTPGTSWSLVANESSNGGGGLFSFALQPIDMDDTQSEDPEPTHVLRTGVDAANSTAIGIDSEVVDGAVSVGNVGALRRLAHVAEALADTQAVIKRQLDEGGLAGRAGTADALEAQVSALETEVSRLEDELDSDTRGVVGGGMLQPVTLVVLSGLALFARRRMTTVVVR